MNQKQYNESYLVVFFVFFFVFLWLIGGKTNPHWFWRCPEPWRIWKLFIVVSQHSQLLTCYYYQHYHPANLSSLARFYVHHLSLLVVAGVDSYDPLRWQEGVRKNLYGCSRLCSSCTHLFGSLTKWFFFQKILRTLTAVNQSWETPLIGEITDFKT